LINVKFNFSFETGGCLNIAWGFSAVLPIFDYGYSLFFSWVGSAFFAGCIQYIIVPFLMM